MRRITLFLFAALAVASVDAASYEQNDGTIVDPIQSIFGGNLAYTGNNLEPNANLYGADLTNADLTDANLSSAYLSYADLTDANLYGASLDGANLYGADLTNAWLSSAYLSYADLTDANLYGADLTNAWLSSAYLSYADLSGSVLADTQSYTDAQWTDAFYDYRNEPTWNSGMNAAWRSSAGILRTTPEPASLLLALLGLALLPCRRGR